MGLLSVKLFQLGIKATFVKLLDYVLQSEWGHQHSKFELHVFFFLKCSLLSMAVINVGFV